eukprot:2195992-Rhodomonas_salina.1
MALGSSPRAAAAYAMSDRPIATRTRREINSPECQHRAIGIIACNTACNTAQHSTAQHSTAQHSIAHLIPCQSLGPVSVHTDPRVQTMRDPDTPHANPSQPRQTAAFLVSCGIGRCLPPPRGDGPESSLGGTGLLGALPPDRIGFARVLGHVASSDEVAVRQHLRLRCVTSTRASVVSCGDASALSFGNAWVCAWGGVRVCSILNTVSTRHTT